MNKNKIDRESLKTMLKKLNYEQLEEFLFEQIKINLELKEEIEKLKELS